MTRGIAPPKRGYHKSVMVGKTMYIIGKYIASYFFQKKKKKIYRKKENGRTAESKEHLQVDLMARMRSVMSTFLIQVNNLLHYISLHFILHYISFHNITKIYIVLQQRTRGAGLGLRG